MSFSTRLRDLYTGRRYSVQVVGTEAYLIPQAEDNDPDPTDLTLMTFSIPTSVVRRRIREGMYGEGWRD